MRSVIRTESFGSVQISWLDEEQLRSRLRGAVERLAVGCPEVAAIILFGSLAEGRATAASDADILIVVDDSNQRIIDRPLRYLPFFDDLGVGVDVFVCTPPELDDRRAAFAADVIRKGEFLFERHNATVSTSTL